jgi:mannitol operon repressor
MPETYRPSPLSVSHPHLSEFERYLAMLRKESDRGAVLISCSMIDELLRRTIRAYMTGEGLADELMNGGNAPVGSFYSRTKLAAALGLINGRIATECDTIRKIRNEFAHAVECTFDDAKVVALTKKLTFSMPDEMPARSRFDTGAVPVILMLTNRPHYAAQRRLQLQEFPY